MNANPKHTNRLIHETSPYLLQHAHNPVQWEPWSEEVLALAKEKNQPILLSIGYAACHWCHVMERESFESETVAEYMNTHFICIKVDREERPDIDHIYMDALQAMTGSGGWPLNIFLLPDGKPFYGGTYFPPKAMPQRASWMDVLQGVKNAFENNYDKLVEQANELTNHIIRNVVVPVNSSSSIGTGGIATGGVENYEEPLATKEEIEIIAGRILQQADTQWGGFGNAPKFPQTFVLQMLFRNYYLNKQEASLVHAIRSIDKMIQGGIYDHLAGGFARYSTDAQWQAPHFEKMLYDNALLITVISEAYQITQKESYKKVIDQTIHFLHTELCNEQGAYYAALDADSEGVEGKFYTWSYAEIKTLLDDSIFEDFCKYYQITEAGNWEHTNILWTLEPMELGMQDGFEKARQTLLQARAKKIRPALDYKIILAWNNLMIIGLCKAYEALGNNAYKQKAIDTMLWIEQNMLNEKENYFYHTHTKGVNKSFAFLDDYASLIQAYIHLQEITGDIAYVEKAKKWMDYLQTHFLSEDKLFYYYTADYQKDIIVRKKETYDGAQPSGNAMICSSLYYLGTMFENDQWTSQAEHMIRSMRKLILQYPSAYCYWAQCFSIMSEGYQSLVAVGPTVRNDIESLVSRFLPQKMLVFIPRNSSTIPMSLSKEDIGNQYFICKNKTCYPPVSSLSEFLAKI
jgi:uncharacterized protein YyaL (SSP411 family)